LLHGELSASLALQPLALPALLSFWLLLAFGIESAWLGGTAFQAWQRGRRALLFSACVALLLLVFWGLRGLGYFGGPIPV
jgi:hypothetical protein